VFQSEPWNTDHGTSEVDTGQPARWGGIRAAGGTSERRGGGGGSRTAYGLPSSPGIQGRTWQSHHAHTRRGPGSGRRRRWDGVRGDRSINKCTSIWGRFLDRASPLLLPYFPPPGYPRGVDHYQVPDCPEYCTLVSRSTAQLSRCVVANPPFPLSAPSAAYICPRTTGVLPLSYHGDIASRACGHEQWW
jgi:hypothetical protein